MVVISKELFYEKTTPNFMCPDFHPWAKFCPTAWLMFTPNSIIGCTKFFLPIYLAQALLNYKKIDKDYIKFLVKAYIRSLIYGFCFVNLFLISNCILCQTSGRLHYYNMCLIGGFIAGLPIFIESSVNRNLNTLYFFNLVAEAAVYNLEWFGFIKRTKLKDTLSFMTCSSLVMYAMMKQNSKPYNNLWFYSPKQTQRKNSMETKSVKNDDPKYCKHKDSCNRHLLEGFLKYFGAGYMLEILKFLLGKYGLLFKDSKMIFKMLFNKKNVLFGLVTGGYVGLYRVITCLLMKRDKVERNYHHLIAGFLSGSTYCIRPNLQFGCIAFTTLMQLLLQRAQHTLQLPSKMNGLLFAVLNGILFHNRFLSPETCPKYIIDMITVCSNGIAVDIMKTINNVVVGS